MIFITQSNMKVGSGIRKKMLPPFMTLPVMGEIAGVNAASLDGCLHLV